VLYQRLWFIFFRSCSFRVYSTYKYFFIITRISTIILFIKLFYLGQVSTLAGKAGAIGSTDGVGTNAKFNQPTGVAVNSIGTLLYVADIANNVLRTIALPSGKYTHYICVYIYIYYIYLYKLVVILMYLLLFKLLS
jgi:hypothetical protein